MGGFLQSTDEEHHGHADLLLPMKVEISDLPHRDCNHPQIQGNTDGCVCPSDGITVETVSLLALNCAYMLADLRGDLIVREKVRGELLLTICLSVGRPNLSRKS